MMKLREPRGSKTVSGEAGVHNTPMYWLMHYQDLALPVGPFPLCNKITH